MPSDWWISLMPPTILRSSARACARTRVASGGVYSLWDKLELRGNDSWTLADFMTAAKDKFGFMPTMVVQGTKMVYVEIMPTHAGRKTKP